MSGMIWFVLGFAITLAILCTADAMRSTAK